MNGSVWYVVMYTKDMKHQKSVHPVIMPKAIIKRKKSDLKLNLESAIYQTYI